MQGKTLILLPDGVALKNFMYTDFLSHGNVKLWTPLEHLPEELDKLMLPKYSGGKLTEVYKNALMRASLNHYFKKYKNKAFKSYLSRFPKKGMKRIVKASLTHLIAKKHTSERGILGLRKKYFESVESASYFKECVKQLEEEKPSFVFCTNQRMINATAPMLAAQSLGIPTGVFIFSWDNLPKGNLAVPADHIFVWSEHMKLEIKHYFPFIDQSCVHVVGTPQFIPYYDKTLYETRERFCQKHGFDINAKIICLSGDDVLTSPYDPHYLQDTIDAVRYLNASGTQQYQILFRRCPVDLSGRYGEILEENKDIVKSVEPVWAKPEKSTNWSAIIPQEEDISLLVNTVLHCETVVNVGSTMAHDFACLNKSSCYFNYNQNIKGKWDIHKVYKFVHFQSMEGLDPVYWVDSKEDLANTLLAAMNDSENKVEGAKKWLQKIVQHPPEDANKRIWKTINNLVKT